MKSIANFNISSSNALQRFSSGKFSEDKKKPATHKYSSVDSTAYFTDLRRDNNFEGLSLY
jgi:hypothetical protein